MSFQSSKTHASSIKTGQVAAIGRSRERSGLRLEDQKTEDLRCQNVEYAISNLCQETHEKI